jgi:hypothetical protein
MDMLEKVSGGARWLVLAMRTEFFFLSFFFFARGKKMEAGERGNCLMYDVLGSTRFGNIGYFNGVQDALYKIT